MEEEIFRFISIFVLTMLKFIAGPTLGYAANYSYLGTVGITVSGMMSSVFLFTFLGEVLRDKFIKRYFSPKKKFSRRSRRFVSIWRTYGIAGVAALTPLIFTPIGGTLMLASTGADRVRILLFMFISALFWALLITGLIFLFGDQVMKYI